MFHTAFPDLRLTVNDLFAENDRVAVRWTGEGTHNGELAGISPTGRRIKLTGMTILRIDGGRIVESWTELDMLGLLQEIGAIPALRPVTAEVSAAGR
jgi:predicted ester cyclase